MDAIVRRGFPRWLRPLLMRNVIAITLGRRIWIAEHVRDEDFASLVRHEMVHVRQMARLGLVRFLWRYINEYIRNRRRGMSHDDAYLAVSFEVEAFAAEREQTV
jgi:hypothetical protein